MAILIPDARRGLLGGLIDDAALLRSTPPTMKHAVHAYLRLRATENGWKVGRLVVPASRLEELAGVLVGTLQSGEAPVPIVTAFDGEIAANASVAAAVHKMLDPAARIERVLLSHRDSDRVDRVVDAVSAGNGIHHSVLSMVAVPVGVPDNQTMKWIAAAGTEALRPAGAWIDLRSTTVDPGALSATIRSCVRSSLPFTVLADRLPFVTQADLQRGEYRYGALNLLAATLHAHSSGPEAADVLVDDSPRTYSINFGGITRNGVEIRSRGLAAADRSPLVSLATSDAADAVTALGALNQAL
ncbi:MAG: hypothetical protein WBN93_04380 [Acidimicrobiia bacterium]